MASAAPEAAPAPPGTVAEGEGASPAVDNAPAETEVASLAASAAAASAAPAAATSPQRAKALVAVDLNAEDEGSSLGLGGLGGALSPGGGGGLGGTFRSPLIASGADPDDYARRVSAATAALNDTQGSSELATEGRRDSAAGAAGSTLNLSERAAWETRLVDVLPSREFALDEAGHVCFSGPGADPAGLAPVVGLRPVEDPTVEDLLPLVRSQIERGLAENDSLVQQIPKAYIAGEGRVEASEPRPSPVRSPTRKRSQEYEEIERRALDDRYRQLCQKMRLPAHALACKALQAIGLGGETLLQDLSGKGYLGNRGAEALFLALNADEVPDEGLHAAVFEDLRRLDFAGQGIANEATFALADFLLRCPQLSYLDLSRNSISEKGAHRLIQAAEAHPALAEIKLEGNPIPSWLRVRLSEILANRHRRVPNLPSSPRPAEASLASPHAEGRPTSNTIATVAATAAAEVMAATATVDGGGGGGGGDAAGGVDEPPAPLPPPPPAAPAPAWRGGGGGGTAAPAGAEEQRAATVLQSALDAGLQQAIEGMQHHVAQVVDRTTVARMEGSRAASHCHPELAPTLGRTSPLRQPVPGEAAGPSAHDPAGA